MSQLLCDDGHRGVSLNDPEREKKAQVGDFFLRGSRKQNGDQGRGAQGRRYY
jgi:hypothetical protein